MSESLETTVTRRPRAERESQRPAETPAVVVEGGDHQTPDAALGDVQSQLQERDRQLAEARSREQRADQGRRNAEALAAQAQVRQQSDRQTVVSTIIDAAKSEQASARAALRSAREAGDLDAETEAFEALSTATHRLAGASAEAEHLKNQPQQQQQEQQQVSSEVQRWWDEHPRYFADNDYQAAAQGQHGAAVRAGKQVGSREYVDFIDAGLTRIFGEGHGQVNGSGRQQQQSRGDGLPPSRGGGGGSGSAAGWKELATPLGKLLYQDRADGTRGVRFGDRSAQENFTEGARMDRNYDKDPGRALAEYTNEHINAALEGYTDLKIGDGRTYE